MSDKKKITQVIDNNDQKVIDSNDQLEKGWAKPTAPSPPPVDIAPLPPQQEGEGESNPQQGESGNTDSKGK